MDALLRRIEKLKEEGYTGKVTLSFHEGSVSKNIKLEVVENTHAVEQINRKPNKKKVANS